MPLWAVFIIRDQHSDLETAENELSAWNCGLKDCHMGNMTLHQSEILFGLVAHHLVET